MIKCDNAATIAAIVAYLWQVIQHLDPKYLIVLESVLTDLWVQANAWPVCTRVLPIGYINDVS